MDNTEFKVGDRAWHRKQKGRTLNFTEGVISKILPNKMYYHLQGNNTKLVHESKLEHIDDDDVFRIHPDYLQ